MKLIVDIQPKTGKEIGLDVGLESFYTDSNGHHEPNPKFLRKAESDIKHAQRRIYKKEKGKNNRRKARARYSKKHLRVSRQRNEHALRLARNVCKSNDLVAYEDLRIRNMVKCHNRAKSISDSAALASLRASASWYQFRLWIEHFAKKLLTAEKEEQKIAVEVKSFIGRSTISEFHLAVGQFLNYQLALEQVKSQRILYLAVPVDTYEGFFPDEFVQQSVERYHLKLLIFHPVKEEIVLWKN